MEPPNPVVAQPTVDAPVDAPPAPKLVCASDTTALPGAAPELSWFCTRSDGTRDGPFLTLFPDGTIEIAGSYQDGLLDGAWQRHHHTSGAIIESGTYAAGQKHGTWRQSNSQGTTLGSYEMNAGTGVEKRWYDEGPLYSETALSNGVRNGGSKMYTKDGVLIEGARYVNGKIDGLAAFGTHRTMRFEETFKAGVRQGPRRIWHQTLLIADEKYNRFGKLEGTYTSWRSSKVKRVEGYYSNGRRTGHWVWNDKNDKKEREGDYVYGKRHGDWLEWDDEKLVWSGSYSYGKPNGTFSYFAKNGNELGSYGIWGGTGWTITFHGNGKSSSKQKLVRGVEEGPYLELSRSGKLAVEGNYSGGLKHGAWKAWTDGVVQLEETWNKGKLDGNVKKYVAGKLATETTFVAGRAYGKYIEYRLDKPAVTGEFLDDRKAGTWTHYNADGAVVRVATYKDGALEGPYRELAGGVVVEGDMVAGRRSGTWSQTDKAGNVRKLTYRPP